VAVAVVAAGANKAVALTAVARTMAVIGRALRTGEG